MLSNSPRSSKISKKKVTLCISALLLREEASMLADRNRTERPGKFPTLDETHSPYRAVLKVKTLGIVVFATRQKMNCVRFKAIIPLTGLICVFACLANSHSDPTQENCKGPGSFHTPAVENSIGKKHHLKD